MADFTELLIFLKHKFVLRYIKIWKNSITEKCNTPTYVLLCNISYLFHIGCFYATVFYNNYLYCIKWVPIFLLFTFIK